MGTPSFGKITEVSRTYPAINRTIQITSDPLVLPRILIYQKLRKVDPRVKPLDGPQVGGHNGLPRVAGGHRHNAPWR